MPLSPTSAPNDIWTNIGVLITALGVAYAGIRTGIKNAQKIFGGEEAAKNPAADKKQILSAAIIETVSIQQWTESNFHATEQMRQLCLRMEDLTEEMRDTRNANRDLHEETRKFRLAMSELAEIAKAFRRP